MKVLACIFAVISGIIGLFGGTVQTGFGTITSIFGSNEMMQNGISVFFLSWVIILLGGISLRFPTTGGISLILVSLLSFSLGNIFSAPFALLAGIFDLLEKRKTPLQKADEIGQRETNEVSKVEDSTSNRSILLDQLSKINDLKVRSVLTEEVYDNEKKILLSQLNALDGNSKLVNRDTLALPIVPSLPQFVDLDEGEVTSEKNRVQKGNNSRITKVLIPFGLVLVISFGTMFYLSSNEADGIPPEITADVVSSEIKTANIQPEKVKLKEEKTIVYDSIFHDVNIKGDFYSIYFYRDDVEVGNDFTEEDAASVNIVFTKKGSTEVVFKTKIESEVDHSVSWDLYKIKSLKDTGKLYLYVYQMDQRPNTSFKTLYNIDFESKLFIQKLFNIGSLSSYYHHRQDADILVKDVIFNDGEDRYDPHHYNFYKYQWNNKNLKKFDLGETILKYDTETEKTEEQVLLDMKTNETSIFNSIKLEIYLKSKD